MVARRNVGTALRPTPDETSLSGWTTPDRTQARTDVSSVAARTAAIARDSSLVPACVREQQVRGCRYRTAAIGAVPDQERLRSRQGAGPELADARRGRCGTPPSLPSSPTCSRGKRCWPRSFSATGLSSSRARHWSVHGQAPCSRIRSDWPLRWEVVPRRHVPKYETIPRRSGASDLEGRGSRAGGRILRQSPSD